MATAVIVFGFGWKDKNGIHMIVGNGFQESAERDGDI